MPFIGPDAGIGYRQKRIRCMVPGEPVPDADGGYTTSMTALDPPALWGRVRPATVADMEAVTAGTVLTQATHLVSLPYHPALTTECVLYVESHPRPDRELKVVYVGNPNERNASLDVLCTEVVPV